MRRMLAALILVAAAIVPARADQLAAGLSTDSIQITSSFRGADIVIFGAVAANGTLGDLRARDIVVALRGPNASFEVRRKARVAGVWVNADEARIDGLPSYYHTAATKPLNQIAAQLRPSRLVAAVSGNRAPDEIAAFHAAAIRAKINARLYGENPRGVELLGPHLFRARMRLPAAVPPGGYKVEVYLFDKGTLTASAEATLPIDKAGLERRLADYAGNQPLPYALATVMMALALGWLGFAVFRAR